jgi:ATP-dependent Clp protease protease subunit
MPTPRHPMPPPRAAVPWAAPRSEFPPVPPGPGRRPAPGPGEPPPRPGYPPVPGQPPDPGQPDVPGVPGWPSPPGPSRPGPRHPTVPPAAPARGWLTDQGGWPASVYQRLLERRIVLAAGRLDTEAASVLSAQLLTLDADSAQPVRLELQGLDAELPAALSVMGVLDVMRAPVTGYVAGRLAGAALGVLAACPHRRAYPSAILALAEPALSFNGTAAAVSAQEAQARAMLEGLYQRLAAVTGQDVDTISADARQGRFFTAPEAVRYGLIEGEASAESRPQPGFR